MGAGDQILAKLTARNIIACTFVFGYFGFLFMITGATNGWVLVGDEKIVPFDLEESPVLTMLLGIMSAALMIITQFYFRRSTPQ